MARITTQSLFETSVHKPSWRSYALSLAVHAGMIVLAFAVAVPLAIEVHKTSQHVSLIAPLLDYKPPPRIVAPKPIVRRAVSPAAKTFVPPPVVALVKPSPIRIEKAPEMKEVQPQPEFKVELPATPKALIQTSAFQQPKEPAKAAPAEAVRVGGFGDPNGVRPSETSRTASLTLAKVGAFDLPDNAGHRGGGGNAQSGNTVHQTAFGSAGEPGRPKAATGTEAIRSTAFGDATLAPPPSARKTDMGGDGFTPVEILFKPKPSYTVEARGMRLEGEVSLQVVFQASGTIRVVRVVRGLGHGLDEAAQQAAQRVRFKPAMRGGVPVDTNATIMISFELT